MSCQFKLLCCLFLNVDFFPTQFFLVINESISKFLSKYLHVRNNWVIYDFWLKNMINSIFSFIRELFYLFGKLTPNSSGMDLILTRLYCHNLRILNIGYIEVSCVYTITRISSALIFRPTNAFIAFFSIYTSLSFLAQKIKFLVIWCNIFLINS
jgi:hypothetical protein